MKSSAEKTNTLDELSNIFLLSFDTLFLLGITEIGT